MDDREVVRPRFTRGTPVGRGGIVRVIGQRRDREVESAGFGWGPGENRGLAAGSQQRPFRIENTDQRAERLARLGRGNGERENLRKILVGDVDRIDVNVFVAVQTVADHFADEERAVGEGDRFRQVEGVAGIGVIEIFIRAQIDGVVDHAGVPRQVG